MKKITSYTYTEKIKYALIAITLLTIAVFVVLPLLPQADAPHDTIALKADTTLAEEGGGGEGAGGAEGGGGEDADPGCGDCGGGGDPGGGDIGGGDGGGDITPPHTPTPPTGNITVTAGACVSHTERSITVQWSAQNVDGTVAQAAGGQYGGGQNISAITTNPSGSLTLNLPAGGYVFGVAGYVGSQWTNLDNDSLIISTEECVPPVWETYCTGADDPNGNLWQWWRKTTNKTPIQYEFVRNGDGTCVPPVTTPLSCDSFTASPSAISSATDVTLTWGTTNADSVSIDNGVGIVAADGSVIRNVAADTTFTLTATRGSETKTCQVFVDLATVNPTTLSCDAFSIAPSSVDRGGSATMAWNTTNADSVSISDIGNVSPDGSQAITVNDNKTYTLTATRGVETKTCTASVSVSGGGGGGGGGGGSSGPRCVAFTSSDKSIQSGESVKLSWKTLRGTKVVIEPDVFDSTESTEVKEGSIIVKPTKDTTYKLIVSRGSRKDTCTTEVRVDDITTITTRDQAAILSFSDIPYTGFDAGPFLTSVFYTLLALWSAAVAYVLVIKKGTVFGFGLFATAGGDDGHGHDTHGNGGFMPHKEMAHAQNTHSHDVHAQTSYSPVTHHVGASVAAPVAHTVAHAEAPMNLPTSHAAAPAWATIPESHTEEVSEKDVIAELENDAHMHNVLLSSDALRAIVDRGETTPKSKEILSDVITRAKASYPREDGWIILNRERVNALFVETKAAVAPEVPVARVEGGSTLAEALVTGNTTLAYQKLGASPIFALADAAEDLDNVLRARRGAGSASDLLMHAAGAVSDEKLKAAVIALTTAIDGTYDDEAAAVRLAIIKALKALA